MSLKRITKQHIQIVIIALLSILIIVLGGIYLTQKRNLPSVKLTAEELIWSNKIKELGGKKAYQELSKKIKNLNPIDQHLQAHNFGKALYQSLGIEGVVVCDSKFSYGCYHEFLGTAIFHEGIGVAKKLNEYCKKEDKNQTLACQHGIGHGIVSYSGYTYEHLLNSLDICSTLSNSDAIGGCPGGVFMEYNFQTMLAENGKIRIFDEKNPYYPCNIIPEKYKKSCYYWQNQWWRTALPGSEEEKFKQMGILCSTLKEKRECYKGTGNIVAQASDYNVNKSILLCNKLNSMEGELYCRSTAVVTFLSIPQYESSAWDICNYPTEKQTISCVSLVR